MKRLLFAGTAMLLCLPANGAFADKKKGYVTDIDFTDKTSYTVLSLQTGKYEDLRVLQPTYDVPDRFYGLYRGYFDMTSGTNLMIFPNGKFAVETWCDICGEPRVEMIGAWKKDSNSVTLTIEKSNSESGNNTSHIEAKHELDNLGHLFFFVLPKGEEIGDSVLVSGQELNQKKIDSYFVRTIPYSDWQDTYSKLQAKLAATASPAPSTAQHP